MKRSAILCGLLLAIAALLLTLSGSRPPLASTPSASRAGDAAAVYMSGTIRSLDIKARTLEVITGVGYALRLYRMKISPTCEVRVSAATGLNGLKPGTIVRIRYANVPTGPKTPAYWVATAIESAPNLDGRGAR